MRHYHDSFSLRDVISRLLDFLLAGAALVILSPVMLAVALAIYLETGGPVIFSQTRLGLRGRLFAIHKFRKFHTKGSGHCPLTTRNDPRMTRVGSFLAKTKLDELPQLWNVIRGDMALVGPRPESMAFADCFTDPYRRVLDYKPGIFGPSQAAFREESAFYPGNSDPTEFYRDVLFPLKARTDLTYYPHRTVLSDLRWVLNNVLAVFGRSFELPNLAREISNLKAHAVRARTTSAKASDRQGAGGLTAILFMFSQAQWLVL